MNGFSVQIKNNGKWENTTGKPVFPFSFGELLDERLDEAYVTLVNDTREVYRPFTEMRVLTNVSQENSGKTETGTASATLTRREEPYRYAYRPVTVSFTVNEYLTDISNPRCYTGNGAVTANTYKGYSYVTDPETGKVSTVFEFESEVDGTNYNGKELTAVLSFSVNATYEKNESLPFELTREVNILNGAFASYPSVDLDVSDYGFSYWDSDITITPSTEFDSDIIQLSCNKATNAFTQGLAVITVLASVPSDADTSNLEQFPEVISGAVTLSETVTEEVTSSAEVIFDESYVKSYRYSYASQIVYIDFPLVTSNASVQSIDTDCAVETVKAGLLASYMHEGYWRFEFSVSNPGYTEDITQAPETIDVTISVTVVYKGEQSGVRYYVVARDDSTRNPLLGTWKHQLYLLERTKLLEGVVCQSLTFTDSLGRSMSYKRFEYGEDNPTGVTEAMSFPSGFQIYYPYNSGVMTAKAFAEYFLGQLKAYDKYAYLYYEIIDSARVESTDQVTKVFVTNENGTDSGTYEWDTPLPASIASNPGYATYWICLKEKVNTLNLYYLFVVCFAPSDHSMVIRPLKKWTVTDCVLRVLQLAEPLRAMQTPKYKFRGIIYGSDGNIAGFVPGSQAEKYDKILAPEFTMTQCTLREQLKIIGSYIHAEPRLDENDEVYFEEYGTTQDSGFSNKPYVYTGSTWDVNSYCTEIRTNASNLVSSLGYAEGVVDDPGAGMYRTLRTETQYVRITAENAIAETNLPIYSVVKVMCGLYGASGWELEPVDITPFIFEITDYNRLSSFTQEGYPNSKAFALYYTQGANNIGGIFYRAPTSINNAVYGDYAITNVLAIAAAGIKDYDSIRSIIEGTLGDGLAVTGASGRLSFCITYKPIQSVTAVHGKEYEAVTRITQIYNQSENLIEARYFGENLRGVAARLGNVERERTFMLKNLEDIPKTGQMLDGYAISAISSEFSPYFIKCTLGLTKNFNRISEYIGISSIKRMYEVSERQVYNRDVFIHNTILITHVYGDSDSDALLSSLDCVRDVFIGTRTVGPVSYAISEGKPKDANKTLGQVSLPAMPIALGCAMVFGFSYKDNYSAGNQATYATGTDSKIVGYWQDDVRYTDDYGRIFWLDFGFANQSLVGYDGRELPEIANQNISALPISTKGKPMLLRKDNRERISVTYELEFKTNEEDIIIGSALARCCSLVTAEVIGAARIVFFDSPEDVPGKFDTKVSKTGQALSDFATLYYSGGVLVIECNETAAAPCYGWAIHTPPKNVTQTVMDEGGYETTETANYGHEILLASNKYIPAGEPFFGKDADGKPRKFYFTILNE